MTKSIRIQYDTASTCSTLPRTLALSLIPPGKKLEVFVTPSTATLFTPLGNLELLPETATAYLLAFHILRDSQIPGKPPLLSGSDCVHLRLVKICANEFHSVSPLRPVRPLLMADNLPVPETCLVNQNQHHPHVSQTLLILTQRGRPDLPL